MRTLYVNTFFGQSPLPLDFQPRMRPFNRHSQVTTPSTILGKQRENSSCPQGAHSSVWATDSWRENCQEHRDCCSWGIHETWWVGCFLDRLLHAGEGSSFLMEKQVPLGTLIFIRCRTFPPLGTDTDVSHSLPHTCREFQRDLVSPHRSWAWFSEPFLPASPARCSSFSAAPASLR